MSEIAIDIKGLSKRYRIGRRQDHQTFRETLMRAASFPIRVFRSLISGQDDRTEPVWVWALRELDFELKQGEVVGIIGPNGAGKSTLLKVISGITEPTAGYADIYGRVGSLLEVGTGFHSELTGRENVYLNGAILGMRRSEIKQKFDEIVAFSGVEEFLDTPVKRYSSGMFMRLAFAVAAHLEPDILLVDEVLAVGDAAFQKKCLGKMDNVAKEGRTVLFVSHNMASIVSLCKRAALMDRGRILCDGNPGEVVGRYLQSAASMGSVSLNERTDREGDGTVRFISIQVQGIGPDKIIRSTSGLRLAIRYRANRPIHYPRFVVSVYDYTEAGIFVLDSDATEGLPEILPEEGTVYCTTDPINLTPGRCFVNLRLLRGGIEADYIQYAAHFDVELDDSYGLGNLPMRDWVICLLKNKWSINGDPS
jgi:lipopolysaccharide transport system ATP-binding protein